MRPSFLVSQSEGMAWVRPTAVQGSEAAWRICCHREMQIGSLDGERRRWRRIKKELSQSNPSIFPFSGKMKGRPPIPLQNYTRRHRGDGKKSERLNIYASEETEGKFGCIISDLNFPLSASCSVKFCSLTTCNHVGQKTKMEVKRSRPPPAQSPPSLHLIRRRPRDRYEII